MVTPGPGSSHADTGALGSNLPATLYHWFLTSTQFQLLQYKNLFRWVLAPTGSCMLSQNWLITLKDPTHSFQRKKWHLVWRHWPRAGGSEHPPASISWAHPIYASRQKPTSARVLPEAVQDTQSKSRFYDLTNTSPPSNFICKHHALSQKPSQCCSEHLLCVWHNAEGRECSCEGRWGPCPWRSYNQRRRHASIN